MSASASKKKRKELEQLGTSAKAVAAKKEQEKKKQTLRTTVIFALVIVVALAAVILLINALNAPSYDVKAPVATVGEEKITVPVYDYFYNMAASNFSSSYSFLLQTDVPLSKQNSLFGEGTMEDYLIQSTNTQLQEIYNVYSRAISEGYTLDEEQKANIEASMAQLKSAATSYGFANTTKYLTARFGEGCTESSYRDYLNVFSVYSGYATKLQDEFAPTEEELNKTYTEDPSKFDLVRFTYATTNAKGDTDEETKETTYTDEAKEAARKEAEEKKDKLDEDGNTVTYGKDTTESYLNEDLAAWLFDDARKEGDVTMMARSEDNTVFYTVRYDGRDTNDYKPVTAYVISITKDTGEVEEGKESAETKLEKLQEGLKDDMTDAQFEEYIKGLNYTVTATSITKNTYDEKVNEFLFNADRKAGDMETVTTDTNYYVLRYVSTNEDTYRTILVKNSLWSDFYKAIAESNEIQIDEAMMKYANTDLTFYSNKNDTDSEGNETPDTHSHSDSGEEISGTGEAAVPADSEVGTEAAADTEPATTAAP